MTAMFVNLPVADLERATRFYTSLGLGHSAFMLLLRDYFQTFTERPICDLAESVWGATTILFDSREAVDAAVAAGIEGGGTEAQEPAHYGFMYQRQLTDPDGHVIELGHMDPSAVPQG